MAAKAEPSNSLQLWDADAFFENGVAGAPIALRYLAAVVMTAVATVVAVAFDSVVSVPNLSLVFVIPVIIAGVGLGLGPSLTAAILGALSYNFFLTAPRYTLAVDDPANIWAIGLLFVVGCIVSAVASTSRRRAEEAALRKRQASVLQAYGRAIGRVETSQAKAAAAADALNALFEVPVVILGVSGDSVAITASRGEAEVGEAEEEAARFAASSGQPLHAGIYPADRSRLDLVALPPGPDVTIVIGLAFDPEARPAEPGTLVEIVGSLLALALAIPQPLSAGQIVARSH
jgi:two-component system sensor histidine kinase KdpD